MFGQSAQTVPERSIVCWTFRRCALFCVRSHPEIPEKEGYVLSVFPSESRGHARGFCCIGAPRPLSVALSPRDCL